MDHYFSENPTSDLKKFKINVFLKEDSFSLWSASGLFSRDELDFASKLLIENAVISDFSKVLDLGCGCGVIGISLIRKFSDLNVFFSDVNLRAISVTAENLKLLKLKGKVVQSDLFEKINDKFDVIISNPPIAAGRRVCFKLIEDSKNYLVKGGNLQLVARHNKGGFTLEKKMEDVFGNVKCLVKKGGFRVYISENV
ncbi:methyltransferase [Candidatus Woesearchaeota archaeon]|nr:methyltransferase [Candidatus Woesearchaeota archaeon]